MKSFKNKSKLVKYRKQNFKIGLIIALTFVIFAFKIEDVHRAITFENGVVYEDQDFEITPPNTQEKTVVKPLEIEPLATDEIIPDAPDIIDKPIPKSDNIDDNIAKNPSDEITNKVAVTKPNKPVKMPLPTAPEVEPKYIIIAEVMPRFSGCEDVLDKAERKACSTEKLLAYIYKNIKYPRVAQKNGITGTVVVSFIIDKKGAINDIKIRREIGGGCGAEVIRVVKSMPHWIPGKQRGLPVNVQFNLPVKFEQLN